MNTTVITGNLTREPEIRYLNDGVATCTFGVAVDRRWQDRQTGQWSEATSFFDVSCWRDLAEHVALSLIKGSRVVVAGRLEQRSWNGDDGKVRTKVELVADDVGCSLKFSTLEPSGSVDC
jgi:single-strand DNA-binding protein